MTSTDAPRDERRRPGRLANLLLVAGSVAVGLVLLEVALRFVRPDVGLLLRLVVPTEDGDSYVLAPDARVTFEGLVEPLPGPVVWQVNAQGLRDDRATAPKGGRFRVAVYGDSEAFGWSVALADTFEKRMEAIDDRVEVLNLGVPGYNVTDVADQIARTTPALDPDLVLYVVNNNDSEKPYRISPIASRSYLYLWARVIYQV